MKDKNTIDISGDTFDEYWDSLLGTYGIYENVKPLEKEANDSENY